MKCTRPRQTESRNSSTKKDDSKRAAFPVITSLKCTKSEKSVTKLQNLFDMLAKKGPMVVRPVKFHQFVI